MSPIYIEYKKVSPQKLGGISAVALLGSSGIYFLSRKFVGNKMALVISLITAILSGLIIFRWFVKETNTPVNGQDLLQKEPELTADGNYYKEPFGHLTRIVFLRDVTIKGYSGSIDLNKKKGDEMTGYVTQILPPESPEGNYNFKTYPQINKDIDNKINFYKVPIDSISIDAVPVMKTL